MDIKRFFQSFWTKIKMFWKQGNIQRAGRSIYDGILNFLLLILNFFKSLGTRAKSFWRQGKVQHAGRTVAEGCMKFILFFRDLFRSFGKKANSFWKQGSIQRGSRRVYNGILSFFLFLRDSLRSFLRKVISFWKQGTIQRGSRAAYKGVWNFILFLLHAVRTFGLNIKAYWKQGKIQHGSRVAYDVAWNIVLFFLIVGLVGAFLAGGIGAGYFASLVKDQEVLTHAEMRENVYNYQETSQVYFAGNEYLGAIRSDLYREEVTLDEITDKVEKAVIATEDRYFMEHDGIVPKAIMRAIYQEAVNADVKTGGSTLTQQLVKNQILTNEVSFERKAKEMLLAIRLEKDFKKEEILEAYLNIVPFGRNASGDNIAGVQAAAKGIFNVNADELNLPQAAYIAGLPQSPSYYTPFTNSGEQKSEEGLEPGLNRMQTVLSRMLEAGDITEQEYQEALEYDITADFREPIPSPRETYPYLTNEMEQRAKRILREQLAEADGYTSEDLEGNNELYEEYNQLADRDLRQKGYKIHTTINKDIYERFQEIIANYSNYGPDTVTTYLNSEEKEVEVQQSVQTGGVLIENSTGKIISFVGGRDFEKSQINFATDSRKQNGSTMKPLLVYAPAMEMGVIQPASVIADVDFTVEQRGSKDWSPENYGSVLHGLTTVREALIHSYNIPAAKIYNDILNQDPAHTYLGKMGFPTLVQNQSIYPAASLGGVGAGPTVEENVNAYSTFGNNGKFADAFMIEKIETQTGETVYEHETEPVDVFSEQTNYLTLDILRDVLTEGTAESARSFLNNKSVDWAGKTGTTNDDEDVWFVATNPNVTIGTWMGYSIPDSLASGASSRNQGLWAQLVNAATEIDPELMAPDKRFERPDGIVEREYCMVSGMKPSPLCETIGLVNSDIFNKEFVPQKVDDSLVREGLSIAFNPEWLERNGYDELENMAQLTIRKGGNWDRIAGPGTNNEIRRSILPDFDWGNDSDSENEDRDNETSPEPNESVENMSNNPENEQPTDGSNSPDGSNSNSEPQDSNTSPEETDSGDPNTNESAGESDDSGNSNANNQAEEDTTTETDNGTDESTEVSPENEAGDAA